MTWVYTGTNRFSLLVQRLELVSPLVRLPSRFSRSKRRTSKSRTKNKQGPAKKRSSHVQWREERALQGQEAMNLVMVCSEQTYP
jgi:hypothetical protein